MCGVFLPLGTFRKVLGPSTTLPLLAVILVVLSVIYIPAAHAEGEQYTVVLDSNGGSWTDGAESSFEITMGGQKTLPAYDGTVPEGKAFAGWSYSDGNAGGSYDPYTQTVDFEKGSTFKMTSGLVEKTSGGTLTLYAVWHPKLTLLPQGEVVVDSVYATGETVTVDLRLPQDLTAGTYELAAGSLPYSVPAEHDGFSLSVTDGVCTVGSSELFPGAGEILIVIPVVYSAGDASGSAHVLVEWTLDLIFIDNLTAR